MHDELNLLKMPIKNHSEVCFNMAIDALITITLACLITFFFFPLMQKLINKTFIP